MSAFVTFCHWNGIQSSCSQPHLTCTLSLAVGNVPPPHPETSRAAPSRGRCFSVQRRRRDDSAALPLYKSIFYYYNIRKHSANVQVIFSRVYVQIFPLLTSRRTYRGFCCCSTTVRSSHSSLYTRPHPQLHLPTQQQRVTSECCFCHFC